MNPHNALSTGPVDINFENSSRPTVAMLAFIPLVAAMLITMVFVVEDRSPLVLSGLLLMGVICCLLVFWFALKTLCDGLGRVEPKSNVVNRDLLSGSDGWPELDVSADVASK